MISGPTTGNDIVGSVTNLLFALKLLHLDVPRERISNKGTAARAIAEPATRRKRQSEMDAISTTVEVKLHPEVPSWPLRHHRIRVPPSTPHTPVSRLTKTFSDFSQVAGVGNVPSLSACLLNVLIGKLLLTYYLNLSRCRLDMYVSYNTQKMEKIKTLFSSSIACRGRETHLNIWDEMKPQHVQVS